MSLCAISGSARSPSGNLIAGDVIIIRPQLGAAFADGAVAVVPKTTRVVVGAGSLVAFSLYSGRYVAETVTERGVNTWSMSVPNAASATFAECLTAVAERIYTQTELAVLAATGLITYASTVAGLAATPPGGFFMVPAAPSGFNIYEDVAGVATLHGSLLKFSNVPQSDATDTTAGRLLTVGAFGLGGNTPSSPADISVAPSGMATGFYSYSTGSSTGGPVSVSNGTLINIRRGTTIGIQIMVADWPGTATNRMWTRTHLGGWSAWREIFHQASLLGPVSQSAGVPTGAVIERGSNANGEYVRFADGTQICNFQVPAVTSGTVWTYPAVFSAAPQVTMTAVAGGVPRFGTIGNVFSTSVALWSWSYTGVASSVVMSVMAVGRWF